MVGGMTCPAVVLGIQQVVSALIGTSKTVLLVLKVREEM